ncbi:MAG: O-antigen ligase family protein [Chloroflexi bacterium]|nr:O-antigen ligase family protein [Chloroflexota bacterium]MCI0576088.1 O-antigen ligase family protein [Chloroflexota bacterium]MCI0647876.1 O-antigen ligase family protein [Chloroflexota bacterium]MCI0727127.1 O-antigen ligase family protein [Chloroflexota bacterium]
MTSRLVTHANPAYSSWALGLLAGLVAAVGGLVLAFGGPLAAVAVVVALVGAVVVLRNLEVGFWGVIGVVCLLPFATIPVDIGLTPTLLDMALGATVGIWALRVVTGRQRTIVTAPVTVPLIVFIIVAVFAFIFGLSNGPLTPTLLRHFAELLMSIAFTLVVVDYCARWEQLKRLVKVTLLAGAGAGAIGIALWLLPDLVANDVLNALQRVGYPGGFVIRYIEDNPALAERAISTSVDPNVLGGLLMMVGVLAGPQLVARRPLFPRWLTAVMVGLILVCLILTFSRTAMLGLAAGLGFVAMARYRRLIPTMAVAALLLLLLPATQGYVARFAAGFQGQDLATQMRFGEFKDAVTLIGRYPLFGVGFAGSPDIDLYLGVASIYLTIGQQMGFLGLASFLILMATVFGYAFLARGQFRGDERRDPVWLGLHAALVGGLVAGTLDHYLVNVDFHHAVTVFWLMVGMATAATRLGSLPEEE